MNSVVCKSMFSNIVIVHITPAITSYGAPNRSIFHINLYGLLDVLHGLLDFL